MPPKVQLSSRENVPSSPRPYEEVEHVQCSWWRTHDKKRDRNAATSRTGCCQVRWCWRGRADEESGFKTRAGVLVFWPGGMMVTTTVVIADGGRPPMGEGYAAEKAKKAGRET